MENKISLDDLIFPLTARLGISQLVTFDNTGRYPDTLRCGRYRLRVLPQPGDIELLFVDPSVLIFVEDLEPVANDHIPGEMIPKQTQTY